MKMEDIYNSGTYLENNPTWHEEDSPWKSKQIKKIIDKNKLDLKSVCEVGCGAGEILLNLQKNSDKATKYFGYDISTQAYDLCLKKENSKLRFFLKDFLKTGTCFDAILLIDFLEHIEDYFGFLKKIRSRCNYLVIHCPIDLSVSSILRNSQMTMRKKFGHIHYFTKETALQSVKDCGYDVVDYFYTGVSVDEELNHNKSVKTYMALLPRKFVYFFNKDLCVRLFGGFSLMILAKPKMVGKVRP